MKSKYPTTLVYVITWQAFTIFPYLPHLYPSLPPSSPSLISLPPSSPSLLPPSLPPSQDAAIAREVLELLVTCLKLQSSLLNIFYTLPYVVDFVMLGSLHMDIWLSVVDQLDQLWQTISTGGWVEGVGGWRVWVGGGRGWVGRVGGRK